MDQESTNPHYLATSQGQPTSEMFNEQIDRSVQRKFETLTIQDYEQTQLAAPLSRNTQPEVVRP